MMSVNQTMKTSPTILAALTFTVALLACQPLLAAERATDDFESGWKFLQADVRGAEQPGFNDSKWKTISLPHDWSIAGPFAETNLAGGAGAFLPSGVAWYRKTFSLPDK